MIMPQVYKIPVLMGRLIDQIDLGAMVAQW